MWGLLAPVIIMGGIYSGIFTPLEAGAIAAVYALGMILARRKVTFRQVLKMLGDSTFASTMVLSIIVGAMLLGEFMTLTKIPDQTIEFVSSLNMSPWGVMATLMVLYVILGMFLEVVSIMLITLPIVYPLIIKLGFDGIWFAVMITLNMEMACITPPVGLNLYAIQGIAQAKLADVLKGVWPFFFIMAIWMFFLALFPSLSTWLPQVVVPRK
jgi:C4-dicarboxylate transporter DctM subunit